MEFEQDASREQKENRDSYIRGMITGLSLMLIFVCLVHIGISTYKIQKEKRDQTQNQQQTSQEEQKDSVVSVQMLKKIEVIEKVIKQNFYDDAQINIDALEEGLYRGMVEALGDSYSFYYSAEEVEKAMLSSQGIYYGIGASVGMDTVTGYPKIAKVYEGTPAQKAGLRQEDIIYKIEGEDVYGLDLTEVVSRIKGDKGTWVNLTIVREGESDYLSINLQRSSVATPTVNFEMLEDGMAYIIISEFDDVTLDQFTEALAMARGNNMKGLILDLRGNPGGVFNVAVEIARKILPEGMIVYTEDKYGHRTEYTCDGTKQLEVPLVILMDRYSGSASEILAGAVKDHGVGTLVGTTTYGKGVVQLMTPFTDGSAVKLTISRYFTPKGNNIHEVGVEPDVECFFDAKSYYNNPERPDNQLEKAKEVLQELMK